MKHLAFLGLLALAACAGSGEPRQVEIVVSAAASLSDVVRETAAQYEVEHPEIRVLANYGGSGALEQQIRQGAGVDLFISAGAAQMESLAEAKMIRTGSRRLVAGNELVLAVPTAPEGAVHDFADLAHANRVAIGAPESVPAGSYARAALRALRLWDRVEPKLVYTADVRQALSYAERGEVDAAIVYRTDAMRSKRVRVAAVAPPSTHPPIVYPAAITTRSSHAAEAERFLDFLAGPEGQAVFRRYGFAPPPKDAR